MKKSDLKTLMKIEYESGTKRIVMLGTEEGDITVAEHEKDCTFGGKRLYDCFSMEKINPDLTDKFFNSKIIAVYDQYGYKIWERPKETPILTLDGVDYSETTLRNLIKKATS